jgi:hypothetical protein
LKSMKARDELLYTSSVGASMRGFLLQDQYFYSLIMARVYQRKFDEWIEFNSSRLRPSQVRVQCFSFGCRFVFLEPDHCYCEQNHEDAQPGVPLDELGRSMKRKCVASIFLSPLVPVRIDLLVVIARQLRRQRRGRIPVDAQESSPPVVWMTPHPVSALISSIQIKAGSQSVGVQVLPVIAVHAQLTSRKLNSRTAHPLSSVRSHLGTSLRLPYHQVCALATQTLFMHTIVNTCLLLVYFGYACEFVHVCSCISK